MKNKDLLEVLQFVDDYIVIEPYEHCHDGARYLHEKLRKIINELVYKDLQLDYNKIEFKKEDLKMSELSENLNKDLTADDAKNLVKVYKQKQAQNLLSSIKEEIYYLASEGQEKKNYSLRTDLFKEIQNHLIEDGFLITDFTKDESSLYREIEISWE